MENVCLRLDSNVSKQINSFMKEFNYSTKTDFIRDAIRCKLKELKEEREKEKLWQGLFAARGALKGKGKAKTDEEFRKLRDDYGKELEKELRAKYNIR